MDSERLKGISVIAKRLKTMTSIRLTTSLLVVLATIGLTATTTIGTSLLSSSSPIPKSKSIQTRVESKTQDRPKNEKSIDLSQIAKVETDPGTASAQGVADRTVNGIDPKVSVTTSTKPAAQTNSTTSTTTTATTSSTTTTTKSELLPNIVSINCESIGLNNEYTDAKCDFRINSANKNIKVELKHQIGTSPQPGDDVIRTKNFDASSDNIDDTFNFHFTGYDQVSVYIILSVKDSSDVWQKIVTSQSFTIQSLN